MELDEFIAETLKQVIDGIETAQKYSQKKGKGRIGWSDISHTKDNVRMVEFDVVVTTTDNHQAKGGGGIFVGMVTVGSQVQSGGESQAVNRIRFSIPLFLPVQRKE